MSADARVRFLQRSGVLRLALSGAIAALLICHPITVAAAGPHSTPQRLLYVAVPGVRNYLEYGGHGILVFAIDEGHRFVRRIPTRGLDAEGKPLNVKGVCASVPLHAVFVSTTQHLQAVDLASDRLLWERRYDGGCDRMAISPDGLTIYLPSLEGPHWHVIDARSGDVIAKVVPDSGSHNTVFGRDGREVYLAGLKSSWLTVADARRHEPARRVGPFSASIRPFTVDASQQRCYVNVNELLGFEVGDLITGKMLCRVEVAGYSPGPVKRHGCPSHGIGLVPDESELWVTDAHNRRLHIFDLASFPPRQVESIGLADEPGWITFSIDGQFAYPSTGQIIETGTRRIVGQLTDEEGRAVQSEKMLEIDFAEGLPVAAGDQFGIGRGKN